MKLSYRGISYEAQESNPIVSEGESGGKYRGKEGKYRYPKHIDQLHPKQIPQKYRGVSYNPPASPGIEYNFSASQPSFLGQSCPFPGRIVEQVPSYKMWESHLENVRQNWERRLQIALEKGDENLVELLQQEREQLSLHI